MYTTSPILTTNLIGLILKIWLKTTFWVADFRDPWFLKKKMGTKAERIGGGVIGYRFEQFLMRKIVWEADMILATTEEMKQDFLCDYPFLREGKVQVVQNGYDEADFVNIPEKPRNKDGKCIFSHIGEIYWYVRNPKTFLDEVAQLVRENKIPRETLEIRFIGSRLVNDDLAAFKNMIADLGLSKIVRLIDFLSHKDAISEMFQADVLLLFQQSPMIYCAVPAKAFEYMRALRPILTVASEGATMRLMSVLTKGPVVYPDDRKGMSEAILDLYQHHDLWMTCLQKTRDNVCLFNRKNQSKQLANLLDSIHSHLACDEDRSAMRHPQIMKGL